MKKGVEEETRGLGLRSACADALVLITGGRIASHAALGFLYGAGAGGDERDKRLAKEIVTGVLRWKGTLERLLRSMSERNFLPFEDRWSLMVMLSGMYQVLFLERVPGYAAIDSTVELVKRRSGRKAASFANALLRRCQAAGSLDGLVDLVGGSRRELVWASYPRWLRKRLEKIYGEEGALSLAEAMNRGRQACIRVDGMDPGEAAAMIMERFPGAEAVPGRWLPGCLDVRRAGDLARLDLHARGLITVQDEGSQIVGECLAAASGDRVLDACCGAGIKSGQVALKVRGGLVVAVDNNPVKIRTLVGEARRLGVDCIRPLVGDSGNPPFGLDAKFDRILVDAPCTGTGTLGRKPEIKYRLRKRDPLRLAEIQGKLLGGAALHLQKGGVLVYGVCSLLPEEGRMVVERFLESWREFAAIKLPGLPRSLIGACEGGFCTLLPSVHGTEGFFVAALTRF